ATPGTRLRPTPRSSFRLLGLLSRPLRRTSTSHVDAALGLPGASPAAATRVLVQRYPAGACRAADRRVTVVHQGIDEDAIPGDVVVYLLLMPRDDRVDLHHPPPTVPLNRAGVAALHRLVPPQPGDPCVVTAEGAFQRLHLAQVAAQVGVAP